MAATAITAPAPIRVLSLLIVPPVPVLSDSGLGTRRAPAKSRRKSAHRAHGPEVAREGRLGEVGVGQREVSLLAPAGSPRVAHDEALLRLLVAHGQHGVAAELLLARVWHGSVAALGHVGGLEAVVDHEAEDEREALGEAALELAECLCEPLVADRDVLGSVRVALLARLFTELVDVVGPLLLGAGALLGHALHPVADLGAAV